MAEEQNQVSTDELDASWIGDRPLYIQIHITHEMLDHDIKNKAI